MYRYIAFLMLFLCSHGAIGAAPLDARKAGAELTAAFYDKRIDDVWGRMDQNMQTALKSRDALAAFREQIDVQLGSERAVLEETVNTEAGVNVYRRRARFEKYPGVVLVQWALAADGQVAGFLIAPDQSAPQPPAPSAHLQYQTKTTLRLPFEDEFLVFWGGRTVEQNYHATNANQRFAYDLVIVRDGKSHAGEGRRNDDYFCFGRPVLAPAAGKVVDAVDNVQDNIPGQMNPEHVAGNRMIIDHGNGEYSLLAHFRRGSLRFKPGDRVETGEHLGDCGNSGNSSEPHLHYQLQDGPEFGVAAGLPAQFNDYLADETPVVRGEPVKGQRIRPATDR